jgi:tryptophan synthase alpha chain
LQEFIQRVRAHTQKYQIPLAVGFGLSTPQHIATVTSYADGAVVGSALVTLIDRSDEKKQAEAVRQYIQGLLQK